MTNHIKNLRTGKLAARYDPRTLRLASYLAIAALPTPPLALTYESKVSPWPMYGNDVYGDCTFAAAAHMIQLFAKLEGKTATPALKTVERDYLHMSPNDQGCVMLDVLNYWRKSGIGGHKLFAFAALNVQDHDYIKLGVELFGGVYLGVGLPISAQEQTGPGKVWAVPPGGAVGDGAPGSWGGHAIPIVGYSPAGVDVITWGAVQSVTWEFLDTYADEAYAALSLDWAKAPKVSGIDFAALQADLSQFKAVP